MPDTNTPPLFEAGRITALFCRHVTCDSAGATCHIRKPVAGKAKLGLHGISCDDASEYYEDPESALLQYAGDNYTAWRQEMPEKAPLFSMPGAFSENITSRGGMTEQTVCIGDIYRMGTAEVQVSYGREACLSMNDRFKRQDMAQVMHQNFRTGWFYRVLKEGYAENGDAISLLSCPQNGWTIARVEDLLFGKSLDRESLEVLAVMRELAPAWRNVFASRLENGYLEDVEYGTGY